MTDKISFSPDEWIANGTEYSKNENDDFIWKAKSKSLLDSFNKWKSSNGFDNYDMNSVKMGVNLKLLGHSFIENKKTKYGNVLIINLREVIKHYAES